MVTLAIASGFVGSNNKHNDTTEDQDNNRSQISKSDLLEDKKKVGNLTKKRKKKFKI